LAAQRGGGSEVERIHGAICIRVLRHCHIGTRPRSPPVSNAEEISSLTYGSSTRISSARLTTTVEVRVAPAAMSGPTGLYREDRVRRCRVVAGDQPGPAGAGDGRPGRS
jgi:hypothetical protein